MALVREDAGQLIWKAKEHGNERQRRGKCGGGRESAVGPAGLTGLRVGERGQCRPARLLHSSNRKA